MPLSPIRSIPQHFEELFGLREDIESLNREYKDSFRGGRVPTADPLERKLDDLTWMLIENLRASRAISNRTGIDLNITDPRSPERD